MKILFSIGYVRSKEYHILCRKMDESIVAVASNDSVAVCRGYLSCITIAGILKTSNWCLSLVLVFIRSLR